MGGSFNLETTMVLVLQKELEYEVEKLTKYKKLNRVENMAGLLIPCFVVIFTLQKVNNSGL